MAPYKTVTQAIRDIDEMGYTQRITQLTVTPEPSAVRLDFTTNVPTLPIVEIFRHARTPNGMLVFNTSDVVAVGFDILDGMLGKFFFEHHARMTGLDQMTLYSFRITAPDGKRPPAVTTGTFTTGRRSGGVVISEIWIANDGDPGWDASGEFSFAFTVYDQEGDRGPERTFGRRISSNEGVAYPFGRESAFTLPRRSDVVTVYVLGKENDSDLLEPFMIAPTCPFHLPDAPTHGEDDVEVRADAFQPLLLPTEKGTYRLGVGLNSGPWGISYIVYGWLDVVVSNPSPMAMRSLSATGCTSTTLLKVGARQSVYTPSGKARIFALGPDGMIMERLPRVAGQRRRGWAVVAKDSGASTTILVRDERRVDLITVADGMVRSVRHTLGNSTIAPADWTVIGDEMQPRLTAVRRHDGTAVIAGLTLAGAVRMVTIDDAHPTGSQCSTLEGRFVGSVAILRAGDDVELAAVSAEGEVQHTIWQTHSNGHIAWSSLGKLDAVHVSAVENDEGKHLIALTRDRRLLGLVRESSTVTTGWQEWGTLDDVVWQQTDEAGVTDADNPPEQLAPMP
jgi:hypothetical protein